MRLKNLITILMALALAGIVAWVGNSWIESRLMQNQEEMLNVVIAAVDIPPYTTVNPSQLRLDSRPRRFIPANPIQDPNALVGKKLREPAFQGEVILSKRLLDDMAANPLLDALPLGMRAMTLRLDDISGHAGFLLPGSRVDIISLQNGRAVTVLKNVKVIAIGQNLIAQGSTVQGGTVTLEVNPRQAEILTEITSAGGIRLVLRHQNDESDLAIPAPEPVMAEPSREMAQQEPPKAMAPVEETKIQEPETIPINVIRGITLQTVALAATKN